MMCTIILVEDIEALKQTFLLQNPIIIIIIDSYSTQENIIFRTQPNSITVHVFQDNNYASFNSG